MKRAFLFVLFTTVLVGLLTRSKNGDSPETPEGADFPAPMPKRPVPAKAALPPSPSPHPRAPASIPTTRLPAALPRSLYGDLPQGVSGLSELPMANHPSPDWRPRLETHLRRTAGALLKSLEVSPQDSYVIMDGAAGRNVEKVIITVSAKDGRFTRFFAEVDSESGHVLKSWGAVIHEASAR